MVCSTCHTNLTSAFRPTSNDSIKTCAIIFSDKHPYMNPYTIIFYLGESRAIIFRFSQTLETSPPSEKLSAWNRTFSGSANLA